MGRLAIIFWVNQIYQIYGSGTQMLSFEIILMNWGAITQTPSYEDRQAARTLRIRNTGTAVVQQLDEIEKQFCRDQDIQGGFGLDFYLLLRVPNTRFKGFSMAMVLSCFVPFLDNTINYTSIDPK